MYYGIHFNEQAKKIMRVNNQWAMYFLIIKDYQTSPLIRTLIVEYTNNRLIFVSTQFL